MADSLAAARIAVDCFAGIPSYHLCSKIVLVESCEWKWMCPGQLPSRGMSSHVRVRSDSALFLPESRPCYHQFATEGFHGLRLRRCEDNRIHGRCLRGFRWGGADAFDSIIPWLQRLRYRFGVPSALWQRRNSCFRCAQLKYFEAWTHIDKIQLHVPSACCWAHES